MGPQVTYRRAAAEDLPRVDQVYRLALNDYLSRFALPLLPDATDGQFPGSRHRLEHDGARFWVAERDGEVVGWSNGLLRGGWWFLASLFVLPAAQARGVGAALLELAMTGMPEGATMATVTDTIQPIPNTMYARRGMLPREVLVQFSGRLRPGLAPPRLGRLVPEPLTAAAVPELSAIDEAASGVDRSVDHRFYLGADGRRGWLYRRAGRAEAYAMVRPGGFIGPLAAVHVDDVERVAHHVLTELAAEGTAKVEAAVPACCEGAQRAMWEAGLVYDLTPGLLLASRPFGRLDRYVGGGYATF